MDLADQVEDFICTFTAIDLEMDSLIMFIFVWLLCVLVFLWLGKFLYKKYKAKKQLAAEAVNSSEGTAKPNVVEPNLDAATANGNANVSPGSPLPTPPLSPGGRTLGPTPIIRGKVLQHLDLASSKQKSSSQLSLSGQNQTTRKRLSRKSPGPDIQRKPRYIPAPSNVIGSDETLVTWTSHVFKWLYSDLVMVNDLLCSWIQAVNIAMCPASDEHAILVEIVRVLPESTPPSITNIFCDKPNQSDSQVVITCNIETTIVLQIKGYRQIAGKQENLHYRATITRFKGHLNFSMNFQTLVGQMKIEGFPDIKIQMATIGPIKSTGKEELKIQKTISEIMNMAIRETLYPVDFSAYSACPRALQMDVEDSSSDVMGFPNPYDYLDMPQMPNSAMMYNRSHMNGSRPSNRRLLVKILKGDGLAMAHNPFCVVEMDEPPQKNQTNALQGINPAWDEHFLFDLTSQSSEILFEVYDRSKNPNEFPTFLGLGLMGIDELNPTAPSMNVIELQPRPYEGEEVFGSIHVEFVFIDGTQMANGRSPVKPKEALKIDVTQNSTRNLW